MMLFSVRESFPVWNDVCFPQGILQRSGAVQQQHRVPAQLHRSDGEGHTGLQTM